MHKKLGSLAILVLFSSAVFSSPAIDEAAEQYVKLVLALGVHDSHYVDAYYGPKQWREEAAENKIDLDSIVNAAEHIVNFLKTEKSTDALVKLRISYLKTQLSTLKSKALMLNKKISPNFDEQSKLLYDTKAPHFKFSSFDKILTQLDHLLPGKEPLVVKANIFKNKFVIPEDKLSIVFDAAIKECRERTIKFLQLLDNESFELEYVKDKPWSGYNWYKGSAHSLIQINSELPIYISRAVDLGCHEGYPGHHTYNALLEANLAKDKGWVEYTVYPLFSPQSLIAEGSANYGIELAFPNNEKGTFERDVLFPMAGLDKNLAKDYFIFTRLLKKLSYAGNEIARLYLDGKIDSTKSVELFQKYTLASEEKAKQRVKFWDTYGAYVINYNWGKDLVKKWVESGKDQSLKGRWKRFSKLLSTPILPSTMQQE